MKTLTLLLIITIGLSAKDNDKDKPMVAPPTPDEIIAIKNAELLATRGQVASEHYRAEAFKAQVDYTQANNAAMAQLDKYKALMDAAKKKAGCELDPDTLACPPAKAAEPMKAQEKK